MNATKTTLAVMAVALVTGCAGEDEGAVQEMEMEMETAPAVEMETMEAPAAQGDLVEVAVDAGNFTTLVAAVQAAGLLETLQGEGPFTVFAPTDEAFAQLPEGTVEGLLEDPEALAEILTYHVIPGRVLAADVIAAGEVEPETVQGDALDVRVMDGTVHVDEATVTTADVMASNGVIHVIDTVLMPE